MNVYHHRYQVGTHWRKDKNESRRIWLESLEKKDHLITGGEGGSIPGCGETALTN